MGNYVHLKGKVFLTSSHPQEAQRESEEDTLVSKNFLEPQSLHRQRSTQSGGRLTLSRYIILQLH